MTQQRQARIGVFSPAQPKERASLMIVSAHRRIALSSMHDSTQVSRYVALDVLDSLIAEVEQHLGRLSMTPPREQVPFLLQLPGLGMVCAMTILAAVGDIARFPTSKQLVGYAGLGTRIHASGQVQLSGGITKEGRRELRIAMVEAAWVAVEHHPQRIRRI
jgi:transposase